MAVPKESNASAPRGFKRDSKIPRVTPGSTPKGSFKRTNPGFSEESKKDIPDENKTPKTGVRKAPTPRVSTL